MNMELIAVIVVGALAGLIVTVFWHLCLRVVAVHRDMLDRIQSPDVADYEQRKAGEFLRATAAKPSPEQPVDIFERKPWEQDTDFQGYDFDVDHENGYMVLIDEDQELHRVPLDGFLAKYR